MALWACVNGQPPEVSIRATPNFALYRPRTLGEKIGQYWAKYRPGERRTFSPCTLAEGHWGGGHCIAVQIRLQQDNSFDRTMMLH
jgi:hypothetical protein